MPWYIDYFLLDCGKILIRLQLGIAMFHQLTR